MAENHAGFGASTKSTAAAKNAASGRNDSCFADPRAENFLLDRGISDPGATQVDTDRTGTTYLVRRDARPWLLLLSVLAVLTDRLTKVYVASHLQMGQAVTVIPHVFRITHVLNFGAAFSIFAESASPEAVRWSLVVSSVIAAVVVLTMLWRMGRVFSPAAVGLALILGGAIGNLYDRIELHYVVDFLEVHIVRYHWPDFNVADSCISVGAVLILIELLWPKAKQTHVEDAVVVE
ncbi:signal peptidase II [Terriglobus sp.]|uniref:signal peptidase II n=1 Tax=Terriglobus sp. TaxID=1889013 RepID=UPI003B00C0FD